MSGASGAIAARGSQTLGSGSYSTATASAASSAAKRLSATTAATMSPTWRTLSAAKAGRGALFIGRPSENGIGCTTVSSPWPARFQSSAVRTSSTPGMPAATLVEIPRIRAWPWGLRTNAHHAVPGGATSSTNCALPRRKRTSSRRRSGWPTYRVSLPGVSIFMRAHRRLAEDRRPAAGLGARLELAAEIAVGMLPVRRRRNLLVSPVAHRAVRHIGLEVGGAADDVGLAGFFQKYSGAD